MLRHDSVPDVTPQGPQTTPTHTSERMRTGTCEFRSLTGATVWYVWVYARLHMGAPASVGGGGVRVCVYMRMGCTGRLHTQSSTRTHDIAVCSVVGYP